MTEAVTGATEPPTGSRAGNDGLAAALRETARRDPIVKTALTAFAATLLVFLYLEATGSPIVHPDDPSTIPPAQRLLLPLVHVGFIVLILAGLAWRLGEVTGVWERSFWRRVLVAFACWLLGAVVFVTLPDPLGTIPRRTVQLVLYALFYLILIRALERQPHRRARPMKKGVERLLAWPAATFFVLGLTIYFIVIPLVTSAPTGGVLAELYFTTVLDAYLVVRLLILWRATRRRRWRAIYAMSTLAWAVALTTDLGLIASRVVEGWPLVSLTWLWWNLFYLLQVLAIRLRHHRFAAGRAEAEPSRAEETPPLYVSARTLSLGVLFPLIHLMAYRFGWLGSPGRELREHLVLGWLIVFGIIALIQHRRLERHAQALWVDRVTFEEQLRESEEDLRLMIERGRAREARRTMERRFDYAFRACPYALAISRLPNGQFIEVNPAFEKTSGYARAELIGRSPADLHLWTSPDDLALVDRLLAEHGEVHELETTFRKKSGEPSLGIFSAAQIELDGAPCMLSIVHDVTARRRAERRLRRTVEIVDRVTAAIVELDPGGRIRSWSGGAERLCGVAADDAVGRAAGELLAPAAALTALLAEGEWSGELEVAGSGERLDAWACGLREGGALLIAAPREPRG